MVHWSLQNYTQHQTVYSTLQGLPAPLGRPAVMHATGCCCSVVLMRWVACFWERQQTYVGVGRRGLCQPFQSAIMKLTIQQGSAHGLTGRGLGTRLNCDGSMVGWLGVPRHVVRS